VVTQRIPALDGLRAVAILIVVASHSIDRAKYGALALVGIAGVMIFFALGGYLITTRWLAEYEKTGTISLRNFYLRRAFRILPPAVTFLAVIWILSRLGIVDCDGRSLLSALFFFSNYMDLRDIAWQVGHFWSLSVEEHFYLIWPFQLIAFGVAKGVPAVLLGALVLCPRTPLGKILDAPPMQFIGKLSYSLYIWQQLTWAGMGRSCRCRLRSPPLSVAPI
jgi:peptidoglycan/LPS O-acetylase OafA/YrhL